MIACYCRVSSARQKTDSQKPEIRRWLEGNGIDPSAVEWFEDKETGRALKRPAFDRVAVHTPNDNCPRSRPFSEQFLMEKPVKIRLNRSRQTFEVISRIPPGENIERFQ